MMMAKESADEGEKLEPADIGGEEIQTFRYKELPKLRDLASGKTTKAKYNKDSGVEELEENSGIKLLLAIKGLGLFTIGGFAKSVLFEMSAAKSPDDAKPFA